MLFLPTAAVAAIAFVIAQAVALPRAVPYLPQTEALCGGAAAAMVMRYWGADARAEDFAPLIDPAQDGIVTTTLVDDLRRRGWQVFPLRGGLDDPLLRQHLSRGRPMIALIEDRPSRHHYVVVTGLDNSRVHFHDPAIAPSQAMTHDEFERRWRAANFWMLLLVPGTEPKEPEDRKEPEEPELATSVAGLLRSGNTAEALRLSTDATRRDPTSAVAWDALATTLFVMDRELDALDAWNRAGRPDVDTVQIAGLKRTRFRAAEQLIAIESDARLTRNALARARRRFALLPSAASTRVSYAPLANGRAQIDAAMAERSRVPRAADLIAAAAAAPFSRDIEARFTNLTGAGERVSASWRFREGFERLEAAIETPAPLPIGAVWKLSGIDARETYVLGSPVQHRWQRAAIQIADWTSGSIGWTAAAGFERWPRDVDLEGRGKFYAAGRGRFAAGPVQAHATAEGWMRGAGAARLRALACVDVDALGGRLTVSGGAQSVHGRTPPFLMPGAGGGHIRAPLLRAHPLVRDSAIAVDEGQIFGRRLLHGTAEWSRPIRRIIATSLDAALFIDAARGWQLLDGRPVDDQIDAGVGLRVRLPAGAPALRFDLARGLRDGRWAFSAGTVLSSGSWIF